MYGSCVFLICVHSYFVRAVWTTRGWVKAYHKAAELHNDIESTQFNSLLSESSTADKACLLSVSSPHASAWLSVVPSAGLGLSLDRLGLDTSPGLPPCALSPERPLDPLDHHALTCTQDGDAVSRHNKLRNVVLQTCHRACISAKAEAGTHILLTS